MNCNKYLKKTCAALTVFSVLLSAVPVFAGADAGEVTENAEIFSESFDSYSSVSEMSPKWFVDGNCSACGFGEADGRTGMYIAFADGAAPTLAMAKDTLSEDITGGTVRVSFDVYLEDTQEQIWSFLDYIQSSAQEDYGACQLVTIHKPEGGSAFIEGIAVETAKWYNVTVDLNVGAMNRWSYGIGVYDAEGKLVGSTGKSEYEYMGTFNNINFTSWKSGKVYIDNLSVKTLDRGLPFYDDMNGYKPGDSKPALINWTAAGYDDGISGFEQIDSQHGSTAFVQSGAAPIFAPYRISEPVTEGKVKVEFDTYITNEAKLWNRMTVVPSMQGDYGAYGVLNIDCEQGGKANVTTYSITPVANDIAVNAWYKVKLVFDLDSKTYTASLYNADGSQVGNTVTEQNAADALSDFSTVSFTTWGDGKFRFDNVSISLTDEKSERPQPVLPITDTFDSYGSIDDMAAVWRMDDTAKSLSSIEADEEGGNVFKLGLDSATDNTLVYRQFPFTLNEGAVNISFSMKPAETASVPIMLFNAERSNFLPVMYVSGGSIFCNTTSAAGDKLFDYTPGEWYDFNIFVDATNRQYRVTKTDSAGNSETSGWYSFDGFKFNDESINNVGSVNFQIWDHKDDAAYFDNLRIYYDEASPVLTNKSVSFLDENGSSTVRPDNTVATETKEIYLDFGVGMDSWFFDSDHVKLINNATGAETAWNSSVLGNCAIIKLTEPLSAETSYTLSVSGEVDSLARVPLGKDFSFDFTTAEGYTDGSVILSGSTITASVTNTTDEAKNYMIAYAQYSGERMTQIAVKNIMVSSHVMNEEFTFDISSYIGTGYDREEVFLWETDIFSQGVETEEVQIMQDYENNIISVTGITEADATLTFMLLNKDKVFSDIPAEGTATAIVQYAEMITADESGDYSFRFQVQPVTGDYTYYIGRKGADAITGTLHFIASSDIKQALEALINADTASAANVLEDNKNVLGFDVALYEQLNKEQTARLVYSLKQDGRLSADDVNTSVALISAAIEAEAIAEGKLSSIGSGLYAVLDSRAVKWCESELFTDKVEKLVADGCRGAYGSISDFDKTFCEKLVMAIVQNPSGWGNVKAIINDFAKEIGITPSSVYDSTYTKIAGNSYSSYTALKSAVESANTSSSSGSGGGGGGSSSSSSGGKSSSGGAPYMGTPQTVIEKPSEIKTFDDLSDVEWAREAILRIYNKGIVSGKEEGRFYPSDSVTREEFVKMLVLTSGIGDAVYRGGFNDVSEGDWFAPYVSAAVSNGICQGIGDSRFGTGLSISREDMAVMVYNLIASKNIAQLNDRIAFDDEQDIAGYAAKAVAALQQYGILNGRDNNMFAPKDNVTRAEAAMVINAVLDYFE